MAESAADVPGKYDVWLNGNGYMLSDTVEPSLPFRVHKALYAITPTFIQRTNTSGKYGDQDQDFFLTLSQNDWSLGEGQRFFRSTDPDRVRRFWKGQSLDTVSVPGQITLRNTMPALTFAASVLCCAESNSSTPGVGVFTASSTNLYLVSKTGSITDEGAHGLGAAPSQWGIVTDGSGVYLSTTSGGTVGVRRWNGSAYSTFSATGADSLAFLNNTLYGYQNTTGQIIKYDGSGNTQNVYTWKDGTGTALTGAGFQTRLRQFGGQLAILRTTDARRPGALYTYDGTTTKDVAEFPANFVAQDIETLSGIVFVAGYLKFQSYVQPAIFYYVNSTTGQLWRATAQNYTNLTWPAMAGYGDGILFTDDTTGRLLQYNVSTGGVTCVSTYTATNQTVMAAASADFMLHTRNATTGYYYPSSTLATSGLMQSSLIDFENTLTKTFRGITVDWAAASGDAGATVDIAYQTDAVDGSWTTLKTGAVSGTEYLLSGVTGRAIAVQLTLNSGGSTYGPIVKRVFVRAAPQLRQFKTRTYIIRCDGTEQYPMRCRDGTMHQVTGHDQVVNLIAAAQSTTPFSVTDRFGTYASCLADLQNAQGFEVYEQHSAGETATETGSFLVRIVVREV